MASKPHLRLYDINANKHEESGAYGNYRSPSLTSLNSLHSPSYSSSGLTTPRTPSRPISPIPSPMCSPNDPPGSVVEARQDIEYTRAPDTFPCGHVLCHNCVRKFMRIRQRSGYSRCPVCHRRVDEDTPMQVMGLPTSRSSSFSSTCHSPTPDSPTSPHADPTYTEPSDPSPVSLLNNFGEIVAKFNGIQHNLRRLKDENVKAKSMGMTFTNTQCHLCREHHGTLRVVQEFNQLGVRHERPHAWSPYFYRLQQGKVVTEFYSQVNSSCICVPCTYKELREQNLPNLPALPDVSPQNTQICLAEVGKIVARNSAPIIALQGKNVIELDHTIKIRERADHFNFFDTAAQIERMVKQQEETMLLMASKQIRDTGRLYHMKESNQVEYDLDETVV